VTFVVPDLNRFVQRRADGTGAGTTLLTTPVPLLEGFRSGDGAWVIGRTGGVPGQPGGRDIIGMRPGVDSAPVRLVADPHYDEAAPALSPDGKWLAYESDESGRIEVYVRPFPRTDDGKWQVSENGGQAPLWPHSGRELFFLDGSRNMVAMPVLTGPSFQVGERRALFRLGADLYLTNPEHYTPFDISPDERRFLMARQVRSEEPAHGFLLVENWFEELKATMAGR
jgi:hypothetical protein